MLKWTRVIFNRATITLYAIGLGVLAITLMISPSQSDIGNTALQRAMLMAEAMAYSILITTLVASILNFSFQSAIEDRFAIVKGAEGASIQRIYSSRKDGLSQIAVEAGRANRCIDILCISGTDVLQPNTLVLKELGRLFDDRSAVQVRVLILDPRSRYAVERSVREEEPQRGSLSQSSSCFDYTNKKLCEDTLLALRQLQTIIDEAGRSNPDPFKLTVRLYNSAPMMFSVVLDNHVFLEQYHMGVPDSQSGGPFTYCLGKAVPLLEVSASSELGIVVQSHFEYLWSRSESQEMNVGSYDRIARSLTTSDWLKKFIDLDGQEGSELTV